tara:strand:+ start:2301 stop:2528 length:228 start_codon:yes stop_codon:yes gene_type:complete
MIAPTLSPWPPGIANQSMAEQTTIDPRKIARMGFSRPPRSSAAPRNGAVSAAINPAHFVTEAIAAWPCALAAASA